MKWKFHVFLTAFLFQVMPIYNDIYFSNKYDFFVCEINNKEGREFIGFEFVWDLNAKKFIYDY